MSKGARHLMRLPTDLHRMCRRHEQQLVQASLTANVDAFNRGQDRATQRLIDWLEQRADAYRLDAAHRKARNLQPETPAAIAAELAQAAIDLAHLVKEETPS